MSNIRPTIPGYLSLHSLPCMMSGVLGKTAPNIVKDSTGSTFNRGDFTATNAFFWSSLDLSSYSGTASGCLIEVTDGAGRKATGYLGAVGAGETLVSDLVTDGNFASAEPPGTAWTRSAAWVISGGVAAYDASLNSSSMFQLFTPIISNGLYFLQYTIAPAGATGTLFFLSFDAYESLWSPTSSKTQAAGTYSYYHNRNVTLNGMACYGYTAEGAFSLDNVSYKRVLDPPSTAVHIVSSLNGTIRNWAIIESGFDPKTIASWNIYSL